MCCAFLILMFLGPRFFGAIWWLARPGIWNAAFNNFLGGNAPWLWAALGIVFVPWTTIMFVILMAPVMVPSANGLIPIPGSISGLDWLWLGLAVAADVAWYASPARRKSISYQGV